MRTRPRKLLLAKYFLHCLHGIPRRMGVVVKSAVRFSTGTDAGMRTVGTRFLHPLAVRFRLRSIGTKDEGPKLSFVIKSRRTSPSMFVLCRDRFRIPPRDPSLSMLRLEFPLLPLDLTLFPTRAEDTTRLRSFLRTDGGSRRGGMPWLDGVRTELVGEREDADAVGDRLEDVRSNDDRGDATRGDDLEPRLEELFTIQTFAYTKG